MKLPALKIGDIEIKIPIIQGGMGVRISKAGLASSVTNAGGLGTVSSVGIGPVEGVAKSEYAPLNAQEVERTVRLAKELAHGGPIAVNLLVAQTDYEQLARACVKAGADILVSGAGLPFMLPEYTKGTNTKVIPIISSARAGRIIAEKWHKRYSILPDAFIVEGILAGGHLGFTKKDLEHIEEHPLEKIIEEVLELTKELKTKYGREIPVIAAGGIYTGQDIAKFIKMGAAGVQMATRFVCTEECDASPKFKQAYLDARKEDITIIDSPVGMPGRAIKNNFVRNFQENKTKTQFNCPYHCLITCNPATAPYCIAKALLNAYAGKLEEGFAFCGANAYRCDKIVKVNDLMQELVTEAEAVL